MTCAGVFLRALAAANPPKPPPTITTRGTLSGISGRPSLRFNQGGLLGILGAKLEKSDQHLVFFLRELLHGAISRLLKHAVDDGLLEFGGNIGIPQALHQAVERVHEVLHEVLDPALATANMPKQARAHHSPPEAGSVTHGDVGVRHTQDSLLDEINDLPIERGLKAIRNMAWEGLA